MTDHGTHRIRLAALLAVVLVAPPFAGATGDVQEVVGSLDVMHHRGALHELGGLALFQAKARDMIQAPAVELHAASGHGWYFERDSIRAPGGATEVVLPARETTAIGSPADPLEDLLLRTVGSSPNLDLRILATEGAASFQALLRGEPMLMGLPAAQMDETGVNEREESTGQDSPTDDDQESFVHKAINEPVTWTTMRGGTVDLQVEGDFILEFYGMDVVLEDGDGTRRPVSTSQTATLGGNDTATRVENRKALRLLVEDATLTFRHTDLDRVVKWVSFTTEVEGDDGVVTFEGLRDLQGGPLETRDLRFADGYAGTLSPGGDHLAVDLAGSRDPFVPTASAWLSPAGFDPLPVATALVAIALVAAAVRTARRTPQLAHMEDALETGSFGRAARVAGRILRTDPTRESAHLGRAIALSRTGRPERVVRDLKQYLKDHEPSDGTLHYVLGLAYRDLGKEAAAEEALSEAVQRTPALAQQVPDGPAPPRRVAAEGDTQGYT